MGAENRPDADASAEASPEENEESKTKAQAAFDRHRAAGMWPGHHAGGTGHPVVSPYPYAMPGWTFPPASGMMPHPPVPQYSVPGQADMTAGAGKSLFESIGNLIWLGVNALNAGLAGGAQVVEGFSGHGSYSCGSHHQSSCCSQSHDCCCGCHEDTACCCDGGHHGYTCGCHESHCCCNPGVHNC